MDTLISSLLGNTAKNLRRIFDYASRQPCVLFLDEFDAIAKARDDTHELGELKRVVNSLLQNMDAYCQNGIMIAATNHQELLDDAIWRRFQTIDDKQAGEYCQSDISILFGTYLTEQDRDTTKKTVINPKGLRELQNILLDNCYGSRAKGIYPHTGFERECILVKYGKKFHPVKKYAIDLADMTFARDFCKGGNCDGCTSWR